MGDLKEAIKANNTPTLAIVASHALSLYRINVDGSDEKAYIEQVKRLAQDLSSLQWLNSVNALEA